MVTVESEPGVGSTFRVLFPKVKAKLKKTRTNGSNPGGKERILFVDDEPLLRRMGSSHPRIDSATL